MGRESDAVGFLAGVAKEPFRYDFYQTLRRIECFYADKPRWGQALRPADEPVRLGQDPDLAFAPAPLAAFHPAQDGRPPRLQVRLFGLLGPNGPLPLHLTDYARERLYHANDATFSRFLDLLQHRFLALFYRAWAQAQPHVNRDRPAEDRFAAYVGAFIGITPAAMRDRDSVSDLAKVFHVGMLVRQSRNPEGLAAVVQHFFRIPAAVQEFVGHWLRLGPKEQTRLGAEGAILGAGAVIGSNVWDRQNKFQIQLGPLTFEQYESFLPGGEMLRKLVDWVRLYLCFELDWDVRLVLAREQVPASRLGVSGRLGWTTWLGTRRDMADAADLCLDAERFVRETQVAAA
jgi:type VI secretion system protein ImpH